MGISPLLLEKDQLASGTNITVRGTLVQQRPPFQLITITPGYPSGALTAFQTGKYQGGCYFKPDNGFESLMFQIGGRLFLVTPGATTASILDVTVPGNPNPTGPNQAFLWQTEKWVIVNDGVSVPIFFDQTASPMSRRSTWNTQIPQATTVTTAFVAPAVGALASAVKVGSTGVGSGVMVAGTVLTLSNAGTWLIQTVNSTTSVDLVNLTGVAGKTVASWNDCHLADHIYRTTSRGDGGLRDGSKLVRVTQLAAVHGERSSWRFERHGGQ